MIRNDFKEHYKILNVIDTYELTTNLITEHQLRSLYKDYHYYQLMLFLKEYELINIKYHNIELTLQGKKYFNFLKFYEKVFKSK